jgi:hypothetical protein
VLVGIGREGVGVVAETFLDDLEVLASDETGSSSVACVCRRSCKGRIRGRPLASINFRTAEVT